MTARILVVDDEPDVEALVLQKFRRQVRDGAVSFLFARDGVEALAALKANGDIDLVVTDINMPRMDGLSLLQKLQESEEKVSTIIVSAYGDMSNIRTAMNRGAFDFVTKPIDFADLETTIAKKLSRPTAAPKDQDILYQRTDHRGWGQTFIPVFQRPVFWATQAIPFLGLIGFFGWEMRKRRLEN